MGSTQRARPSPHRRRTAQANPDATTDAPKWPFASGARADSKSNTFLFRLTVAFLTVIWGVCIYRAATQSFVCDEAFTSYMYLQQPVWWIFRVFSANHHFLNTVLMRLSVHLFGMSELALRLPALGGAALMFGAVYKLARDSFGPGWRLLLAVAALTLNPLTLDFMVAARGYGLGLALLTSSIAGMVDILTRKELPRPEMLMLVAVALSSSVTANLCFALPAAAIGLTFVALEGRQFRGLSHLAHTETVVIPRRNPIWSSYCLPIIAVGILFATAFPFNPLNPLHRADFYAGSNSLVESARNLADVTLLHSGPMRQAASAVWPRDVGAFVIAPLLFAVGAWFAVRFSDPLLILALMGIGGPVACFILLHISAGTPYPVDRTGIYFGPLLTIVLCRIVYLARMRFRLFSATADVLLAATVVLFVTEFDVKRFVVWEYDADTKLLAEEIARRRPQLPNKVSVGGDWMLFPALDFYRVKNKWEWMAPVLRQSVDLPADIYAFVPSQRNLNSMGFVPVWTSPNVHSVLAVRAAAAGNLDRRTSNSEDVR